MKNAQLWKRILHEGIHNWKIPEYKIFLDAIANAIIVSPIIVDTRPCDDQGNQGESSDPNLLTGISTPFDKFWIEQRIKDSDIIGGAYFDGRHDRAVWSGRVTALMTDSKTPIGFYGCKDLSIEDGRVYATRMIHVPGMFNEDLINYSIDVAQTTVLAALDTLKMLGCKNVFLSPRDNDQKQARIARKRHGPSSTGYRYHVLTVRPPGAKSDSPGIDIGTMPRHVCRGHFNEYGPEFGKGLLFGRLSGRFFIPPHVRGDKKNGIVEKDYEVRA